VIWVWYVTWPDGRRLEQSHGRTEEWRYWQRHVFAAGIFPGHPRSRIRATCLALSLGTDMVEDGECFPYGVGVAEGLGQPRTITKYLRELQRLGLITPSPD